MVWNQQRTLLECYEEPCLIGSELLNKAVENPEALNPKKRTPKNKRRRSWDWRILEEIKRLRDRDERPNLGAEKLHPLLLDFCNTLKLKCPGSATIERIIKDLGGLRVCPQKYLTLAKLRKPTARKY